ncbi:MAG: hypothetical protein ACJ79A_00985 [Gemmatimonadaceae bacterium]
MFSSPTRKRLLLAFLVAPLAAPIAFTVAAFGVQVVRSSVPTARSTIDLTAAVFAVGTPVAYLATLAVGAPLYFTLHALGLVRHWTVWLGAAAIGAAVAIALSPYLHGELFSVSFPWWAGALLGVASAELFWRVGNVNPSGGSR